MKVILALATLLAAVTAQTAWSLNPKNTGGLVCTSHDDCPRAFPFCYTTVNLLTYPDFVYGTEGPWSSLKGTCQPCKKCEHCLNGIDYSCGSRCDIDEYPLYQERPCKGTQKTIPSKIISSGTCGMNVIVNIEDCEKAALYLDLDDALLEMFKSANDSPYGCHYVPPTGGQGHGTLKLNEGTRGSMAECSEKYQCVCYDPSATPSVSKSRDDKNADYYLKKQGFCETPIFDERECENAAKYFDFRDTLAANGNEANAGYAPPGCFYTPLANSNSMPVKYVTAGRLNLNKNPKPKRRSNGEEWHCTEQRQCLCKGSGTSRPRSPEGGQCKETSDCMDGLFCNSANLCALEGTCAVNDDCTDGQTCKNNLCVTPEKGRPGQQCEQTSDCMGGLFCNSANVCALQGTCAADDDCTDGQTCKNNLCVTPDKGRAGEQCKQTVDCMDGLFCTSAKVCAPKGSCAADDDCTDGQTCKNNQCANKGEEGDQCKQNSDCVDGLSCISAKVCPAEGGCATDIQICQKPECIDAKRPEGDQCDQTSDCMDGLFCNSANMCAKEGSCAFDDDCINGQICQRNVCVEDKGDEGDACKRDLDCKDGLFCNSASECAVEGSCATVDDCGLGKLCEDNLCVVPDRFGQDCWWLGCNQDRGVCDLCGEHDGQKMACCRDGWRSNNAICKGAVYVPSMSGHHHCVLIPSKDQVPATEIVGNGGCSCDINGRKESYCRTGSQRFSLSMDDCARKAQELGAKGFEFGGTDNCWTHTAVPTGGNNFHGVTCYKFATSKAAEESVLARATHDGTDLTLNGFAVLGCGFLLYGAGKYYLTK